MLLSCHNHEGLHPVVFVKISRSHTLVSLLQRDVRMHALFLPIPLVLGDCQGRSQNDPDNDGHDQGGDQDHHVREGLVQTEMTTTEWSRELGELQFGP